MAVVGFAPAAPCADSVDPFVGTSYSGNVFPGPTRPFGFVQPSPDTGTRSGRYAGGYKHRDETVYGFSQTHLSGMGCADLGDVLLLPYTGKGPQGAEPFCGAKDLFREKAELGYYSVALTNFGITAEIAATHRVGLHRWTYPAGAVPKVLVDLQWGCYDPGAAPQLREGGEPGARYVLEYAGSLGADGRSLSGRRVTDGWMRGRTVAWHLRFSRPWKAAAWVDDPKGGKAGRYLFEFAADDAPLECRVAISSCDEDGARRNYEAEAGVGFEQAVADTRAAWQDILSRMRFETDDVAKKRILHTALYHACVQPIDMSDADGRYRGGDRRIARVPDGAHGYYSNLSTWDTFRSVHALYALLVPERVDDMVRSMLEHYKAAGCLPIHSDFGIENQCMVGVHSVPIVAEAYLKGFRGFDAGLALEAMTNSLTVAHAGYPREDWDLLERHGYIPFDKVFNQSASRTLEVAYDDACVAKMAAAMGREDVARRFARRSQAWTNLFDATVGFARGRDSRGRWREPFDPDQSAMVDRAQFDFTEGSSWTYTWHVMQDPMRLMALMGGKDAAADKLEDFFSAPRRYEHANEPGHHVAYLFQYAGRPRMTERLVRKISESYYSATDDGITGNDDCGQMSAWYVFAALGFYPVDPCSCEYVLGAPQVDRAVLRLAGGKTFEVAANGLSDRAQYVKGVRLNGRPLGGFVLRHADLAAGGKLAFDMGEEVEGGEGLRVEGLGLRVEGEGEGRSRSRESKLKENCKSLELSNLATSQHSNQQPTTHNPQPTTLLPCFRDWNGVSVDSNRWFEIVRKWTHDELACSVFGQQPVGRPSDLSFETLPPPSCPYPDADAVRVRISYGGPGGRGSFDVLAFVPRGRRQVGAFVLIGDAGFLSGAGAVGNVAWPVGDILQRGYAAVVFDADAVCPDDPAYRFDRGAHAVYSPYGRSRRGWGAVAAWAWGASRVMDWLETLPAAGGRRVAVVGHGGKGTAALWAAADDTRFGMACVSGSGAGGAKMGRVRVPYAEDVAAVNALHPHWFATGWRDYNGREEDYRLDAHDVVALVAPRLLAVGCASEDAASGPVAQFAAAKYGSHAWEACGVAGIGGLSFPAPGERAANGNVSFHLRKGAGGLELADWRRYLDFADEHGWRNGVPKPK